MRPWETVGGADTSDFRIFRVRRFLARSPRTGDARPFTVLECPDWVNVIARTPDGSLVLVRQYRHGTGEDTLEIPGGMVDPGEEPARAAARELREETGFAGEEPVLLGVVEPNPAIQTNRCHTYLIDGCRRVADAAPDPGEDLEVEVMPEADVLAAARDGRIRHALVLCALLWWRDRRGGGGMPAGSGLC